MNVAGAWNGEQSKGEWEGILKVWREFFKKRVAGEEVKSQNVPSHNFIGGIYSFFDVYTGNN